MMQEEPMVEQESEYVIEERPAQRQRAVEFLHKLI